MKYKWKYKRGLRAYNRGDYHRASAQLHSVAERKDLAGKVARFYEAMSHRGMGVEAMREGRYGEAEKHLRMAVSAVGTNADLASYLSKVYARTGCFEKCAGEMEKITDSNSSKAKDFCKFSQAQWRCGKRSQAYMTLHAALRRFGDEACLHLQLGLFLAGEERFDEAKKHLVIASEADSSNADTHYYLGMLSAAQQDARLAVRSLQRAFELRPDNIMIAYKLCLAAKAASEEGFHIVVRCPEPNISASPKSEIYQLARYVEMESDFVSAFMSLPKSEFDEELFGVFANVLQMAIADHPNFADLQYNCSRVLKRLGKTDVAIEHAEKAVEINPRYVKALIHLAKLYKSESREPEAVACLEQAIENGADWPDVHCLAGELLGRCNEIVAARGHLEHALKLNGRFKRAAVALVKLAA